MSDNELDTTVDEWRDLMDKALPNDPGLTVAELCEKFGSKQSATRSMLSRLMQEGKCRKGRAMREGGSGRYHVSVYQLLDTKAGEK